MSESARREALAALEEVGIAYEDGEWFVPAPDPDGDNVETAVEALRALFESIRYEARYEHREVAKELRALATELVDSGAGGDAQLRGFADRLDGGAPGRETP